MSDSKLEQIESSQEIQSPQEKQRQETVDYVTAILTDKFDLDKFVKSIEEYGESLKGRETQEYATKKSLRTEEPTFRAHEKIKGFYGCELCRDSGMVHDGNGIIKKCRKCQS